MIEAAGLTKRYGAKTAVYQLSFQVRPGVVTGFLGPNGSGKSTTMRMMLGLDAPTSGSVTISGLPYRQLPNPARHVGALLDAGAVHGGRSAYQHLLCLAQLSGLPARRVDEVLGVVGLRDVARNRSRGFSLGMAQRLGIAAALLGDPQVLLFDEPVNGLDPEGILWIRHLMKQLASEGRTVFVSSHLMSEMALTADHLIVIGRGQLLADMSVKDFIAYNSQGYARVRVPDGETEQHRTLTETLTRAGGQVGAEEDGALRVSGLGLPQISELAHVADVRLWELSPHHASLEEAYMRMTQNAVDYRAAAGQPVMTGQPTAPHGGATPQPQAGGHGPWQPQQADAAQQFTPQGAPQRGYQGQGDAGSAGRGWGGGPPVAHEPYGRRQPWPGGVPGGAPQPARPTGFPTSGSGATR